MLLLQEGVLLQLFYTISALAVPTALPKAPANHSFTDVLVGQVRSAFDSSAVPDLLFQAVSQGLSELTGALIHSGGHLFIASNVKGPAARLAFGQSLQTTTCRKLKDFLNYCKLLDNQIHKLFSTGNFSPERGRLKIYISDNDDTIVIKDLRLGGPSGNL
jgi:hypothetical protein